MQPIEAPDAHPDITSEVIHYSVSPWGQPLITVKFTCPTFIIAQINTNRTPSKSFQSMRASPNDIVREQVWDNPYRPSVWLANEPGMTAGEGLTGWRDWLATTGFRTAWAGVTLGMWMQRKAGVAKETVNRLAAGMSLSQGIMSSTGWGNQLWLRMQADAQPEYRVLAYSWARAIKAAQPVMRDDHIPWVEDVTIEDARRELVAFMRDVEAGKIKGVKAVPRLPPAISPRQLISAARLARVSTLTHDKKRDLRADIRLGLVTLLAKRHVAPFEHVARAVRPDWRGDTGNFKGWLQARKHIPGEAHGGFGSEAEALRAALALV